jgi:hypothetical protein
MEVQVSDSVVQYIVGEMGNTENKLKRMKLRDTHRISRPQDPISCYTRRCVRLHPTKVSCRDEKQRVIHYFFVWVSFQALHISKRFLSPYHPPYLSTRCSLSLPWPCDRLSNAAFSLPLVIVGSLRPLYHLRGLAFGTVQTGPNPYLESFAIFKNITRITDGLCLLR